MIIQVNTDHNVTGDAALTEQVDTVVRTAVQYLEEHITRVEVHLSDENSDAKSGSNDKRCRLEARVAGRPPVIVSHNAESIEQSLRGAAGKLRRSLDTVFGKLHSH